MDPAILLLLSLLTAHLLADFVLQSNRDIGRKAEPLFFAKHIAIVTALSWLLAGDWTNWVIPAVIGLTHGLLDWGKLAAARRGWNGNGLFVGDQAGHLLVIAGLAGLFGNAAGYENALYEKFGDPFPWILILGGGLILTVRVGGMVIGMATARFLEEIRRDAGPSSGDQEQPAPRDGLIDGGRVIGQLERALIFFFVLVGKPEAVAFLVAAKSIFRFGELTKNSRKEAEYILIGTLMSFGWGLAIAWGTRFLLLTL